MLMGQQKKHTSVEDLYENTQTEVSLNDFLTKYQDQEFQRVIVENEIKLKWYKKSETTKSQDPYTNILRKDSSAASYDVFYAYKPLDVTITELGITPFDKTELLTKFEKQNTIVSFLVNHVLPLIFFVWLLMLLFRFMGPKGWGMPFNFKVGKQTNKKEATTRFSDIAWMEEVKQELTEIVDFLKNPQKYHKVGARPPKGVLLYGQPWSGKTLLARAVAWESDVAFFTASWSEFMEMLVWMGASKVRQLFGKAKAAGRAIIFIDEIDAIGKKRGAGYTGWHQEQEQTLNQILTEMDWFDKNTNIVVMAATNRPDTLDPALLRSGRFDRKVYVRAPMLEERVMIFEYYLKNKKYEPDVNLESLGKRTSGLVGADIENIVNEASLKLAKENRKVLSKQDFEYALEKTVMWPEKKIKSMNEQEKKIVAFHELGHAVTAHLLSNTDPVEKISIVSRWQALWVTWMMPDEDKYLYSKAKFLDESVTLLGGRAAEYIFFGKDEITTGASNDFERATKMITDLVVKYGMDEDLGPVMYMDKEKGEYNVYRPYSEQTAELIDKKVKEYLEQSYKKAIQILETRKEEIKIMADVLLKKEYLTKEEFEELMKNIDYAKVLLQEFQLEQEKNETQKEKNKEENKRNQIKKTNRE